MDIWKLIRIYSGIDFLEEGCKALGQSFGQKPYRKSAFNLGLFYAAELTNYQLVNILLNSGDKHIPEGDQDMVPFTLHMGMIIGSLVFGWLAWSHSSKVNRLLKVSIWIHLFGAFLTAVAFWWSDKQLDGFAMNLLYIARFIFGFGFAAGLGLAMTLISENFPRSLRTWAATSVGAIGFMGPLLAEVLSHFFSNKIGLLLFGCAFSVLTLFRKLPKDSEMRKAGWEEQNLKRLWQVFKDYETLKLFGICSLMGISVQFFSDMVGWLPRIEDGWKHDWPYALRYGGLVLGTIIAGSWSKRIHQRRYVIRTFLISQLMLASIVIGIQINCSPTDLAGVSGYVALIYFAFGIVCGNWIITILQTTEQFSLKDRPLMAILVPNFYRVGTIVIIVLNLIYKTNGSDQNEIWFKDKPLVLFAFWILFILASLAASLLVKDNFEGDALDAEYSKSGAMYIAGRNIRNKLQQQIPREVRSSREGRPFLRAANHILFEHLQSRLKGYYVLSTIYYSEEGRKQLESAGFGKEHNDFDETTCKRYEIGNLVPSYKPVTSCEIGHELIQRGKTESLMLWMSQYEEVYGFLLHFSGWQEEIEKSDLVGYRTFDLSEIDISNERIAEMQPIIRQNISWETRIQRLDELYKEYGNTFERAFCDFIYKAEPEKAQRKNPEWEIGIKKNLIIHRLDAHDYGRSNYYNYYIKPYYQASHLEGAIVLKTVVQLKRISLGQIKDLLTFIFLLRSNALLDNSATKFFREEDHATRGMLNDIQGYLKEFHIWYERRNRSGQIEGLPEGNRLETIQRNLQIASSMVEQMHGLRLFNMALIRYYDTASREELEKKGFPKPSSFFLRQEINLILERIKQKPETFQIKDVEDIGVDVSIQDSMRINVVSAGMRVIIEELIRNAAFNANEKKPVIFIQWIKDARENVSALHFRNNWKSSFTEDQQEALRKTINEKIFSGAGRLGIPTIHRILGFPWLSASGKPWKLKCRVENNLTDIYLIIPSEDIEWVS